MVMTSNERFLVIINSTEVNMNQQKVKQITTRLADRIGLVNITKDRLCFEADIPVGSFNNFMGCSFTKFISKLHAEGDCNLGELGDRSRVNPDLMTNIILNCAIKISEEVGYKSITRIMISDELGIASTLVSYYFKDMNTLKKMIVEYAVDNKNLTIIAQALTLKDEAVNNISNKLKNDALKAAINA